MNARTRLPGTPRPTRTWPGSGGVTIAGDEWGQPGAPLVVLQHGGGQTRHAWKGTGEALARAGFHAVSLDARGHGDSDWAQDGNYGSDVMVADLVAVCDAIAAETGPGLPPTLVGASMGGGVSLSAVGERHLTASALVLVDMAPRIEPDGAQRILDFMAQAPEGFDTLEEVADAIGSYQPHRSRPRSLDGLAKNVRRAGNGKFVWHWDPRWLDRTRPHLEERTSRLQAATEALTLPTLLVRGGLSDVLSESGARSFLETCPHSEYVNVTDAAHMVAGDRNDIFSAAVIEFLSRVLPVDG